MKLLATLITIALLTTLTNAEAKTRHHKIQVAAECHWWQLKSCEYAPAGSVGRRHEARGQLRQLAARTVSWGGDLVSKARSYMGTNPTGWRHLWCGKFMAMIAPEAASRIRNPNMARDWASLPHTSAHVGAIVVLSRGRGGGHVGVLTGLDPNGNPIVVSGNHNRVVGEGVYPRSRVLAYVQP